MIIIGTLEKIMIYKNKLFLIISAIVLISFSILFLILKKPLINVAFISVDDRTSTHIIETLNGDFEDYKFQVSKDLDEAQLIFTNDSSIFNNENFSSISTNINLPSSFIHAGTVNNRQLYYPLQLDFPELLLRDIAYNSLNIDDEILLDAMIELFSASKAQDFFPLVVAGKDDQSFLDFLSLMLLTTFNSDTLYSFYTDIEQNAPLNPEVIEVLDTLIEWRQSGLLHKEWLEFDKETVLDFLENNLALAAVIRLSEHRTYPTEVLKKFVVTLFPDNRESTYAKDLLVSPLYFGIKNSELQFFTDYLLNKEFQKTLTHYTGLAPVNPNVIPLDKQATDLRYWGAASKKLVNSFPSSQLNSAESYITKLKTYLISHK